jgi:hypothetical protein
MLSLKSFKISELEEIPMAVKFSVPSAVISVFLASYSG